MIPIHRRLNDPFYFIMVYSKTFADFLKQYVLNGPVDTRIEMQGCTEDYSVIKVEFIRTEEGFQYNKEFKHENAEMVHAMMSNYVSDTWTVTPEAWLPSGGSPPLDCGYPNVFHLWPIWNGNVHGTLGCSGKKVFRSLMDLPPLDIGIGGSTELWENPKREEAYIRV
ncbi:uncharacterized protein TNIN_464971 [Trichonephila inaurata madagascariensis]|uniref:Uncharacterized protein n=1 Tax=Trichonephila inaurata madagascariensis TaxID=2747483 RepID=A0A8X6YJI7_9ARAC|nr:uncharacterized protein TNIN_464971 [Trichonephila inaurata madagascariensis]